MFHHTKQIINAVRINDAAEKLARVALLVAIALLVPITLIAQGTTASLGGTVLDATGAIIRNAEIQLTNEKTGDVRSSKSNGSGVFSFAALPTGDYDILITATSFAGFEEKGIHLDPGDQRTVRQINLAAGSSATVEVSTTADRVNTDSGEQSSLITSQEIEHLAVEGRDVTELLKILPGFAISNGGSGNVTNTQYDPSQVNFSGALGSYAANGTPVNGQALLSDGVDITDPGNFGQAVQNVNYEQVSEVKVQTGSFTADTAHGPIVINAVGKSGGNTYHGSLYTFARTYQLNSNDWIANNTGQAKPPDRFVYPGGTFGGPVLIPGTNFNHNRKLTFFIGAEDYAQRNVYAYGSASAATLTALVPTAGMRAGDFSQGQLQSYLGNQITVNPAGAACTIPQGAAADQNICTVPVTGPDGSAIVNGNIGAFIDPLSKLILNGFPLPNTPSNGTYNYITTNLINNDLYQARGRFDYSASEKDKIFGSYSIERGAAGVPQNEYYSARGNLGGVNIPGGGLVSTVSSHVASINYTHIFSASLTNEFYVAGAYFAQDFLPKNLAATAGDPYAKIFNNGSHVQPTLEDYGNDGLPLLRTPDGSYGGIFAKKQIHIGGDNVTKVIGKHTFRAGIFYQWDDNPQVGLFINSNGTVNLYYIGPTVNDPTTANPGHTVDSTGFANGNGGNFLADFAEGQIFQYNQTNIQPEPNLYFYNFSGYIQDHWRLSSRVTVDAGIRLEHFTPWTDTHGQGVATFSPATYAADAPVGAAVTVPLPGVRWHGIDSSVPLAGRPTRPVFASPRGGVSWDAYGQGKTIVRAGAGIYRAHDAYNDAQNQQESTLGLRTSTVSGPVTLRSIGFYAQPTLGAFLPDSNVYGFDPKDDEQPRVITYNLAVDQRLPGNMLLELAYVGNKSDKLENDGSTQNTTLDNLNSLPIGSLFGAQPNTRPDAGVVPGTLYPLFTPVGAAGTNTSITNLSQAAIDSYKKYPLYNHVYVPEHNVYSNYNGLQVGLVKQQGHGTFSTNYTFSKALGVLGIGGSATYSYPGDPFNYHNDYASLPFDRRHIFNAAYSYVIGNPIQNKLLGGFTNGWEVSGITNYQSGPNLQAAVSPNYGANGTFTVPLGGTANTGTNVSTCQAAGGCAIGISNTDILGTPDVNLQPTVVGDPSAISISHQHINPNAFSLPNIGANGPYRYAPTYGPAFFDTDLTAAKRFKIFEKNSVQLRIAAFNFINHANYTFDAITPSNYTIAFNQTTGGSLNQSLQSSRPSNATPGASQFGFAPLKTGRRILELGLRYDF